MKFVDLHTHSTVSDGSHTALELVDLAKRAGLAAIAITDHDNLQGYEEAAAAARAAGIELLSGIELSVDFKGGRIHLLGLGFDVDDGAFQQAYAAFRAEKTGGVPLLLARLAQRGMVISDDDLAPYKIGEELDRYTVFRYFAARKEQDDVQYIWDQYLNPALVGIPMTIEAQAAIDLIKNAGGITSLAHFHKKIGLKRFSAAEKEACIRELCDMGMDAVEAQYPDYTQEDCAFMAHMAEKYHLLRTGGTDFHGANRPAVQLGSGTGHSVAVPYAWYEEILARCRDK